MTTLPQRRFGDPLDVLIKAEAETCKGCVHVERFRGEDYCLNPKTKAVLADKRCDEYEETQ